MQARTCIKGWMRLNFSQTEPLTTNLAALEGLNSHVYSLFFACYIDPILFKLAGYKDMHKILDELEFRSDPTTNSSQLPVNYLKDI